MAYIFDNTLIHFWVNLLDNAQNSNRELPQFEEFVYLKK